MSTSKRLKIYTYVGATGRPLGCRLHEINADTVAPMDVSSEDYELQLYAKYGGGYKISEETMTKVAVGETDPGELGDVQYYPAADEIDVHGTYEAQVKIIKTVGEAELVEWSDKFDIIVQETLEIPPEPEPEE
jgi:hypothetical protein